MAVQQQAGAERRERRLHRQDRAPQPPTRRWRRLWTRSSPGRRRPSSSSPRRTSPRWRCSRPWARGSTTIRRGLPGKRYYGGCQIVDQVEDLARERCKELFGADHANVQPHSGSQANTAAYASVLKPGDTVLGMALDQGGHLTHGSPVNFSGKLYNFEAYTVSDANGRIDYDEVRGRAHEVAPAMIVAGYSSDPRVSISPPSRTSRAMSARSARRHGAFRRPGRRWCPRPRCPTPTSSPSPLTRRCVAPGAAPPSAAPSTPRRSTSLSPGTQGGPQMHAIAAKAVMFQQCLQPEFRAYAHQVVSNAKTLASALVARGVELVTGGTDNHLMVIDCALRDPRARRPERFRRGRDHGQRQRLPRSRCDGVQPQRDPPGDTVGDDARDG